MSFLDERSFLFGLCFGFFFVQPLSHIACLQFFDLFAIVLIESHVVVANEVVALLSAGLGSFSVAIFHPCEHGFANVDAAVVNDVGLHNAVTVGLLKLSQ